MDKHPQPAEEADMLEIINFGLTVVFILEMLLKIPALGLKDYLIDPFNRFDAFIVIVSILELILAPPAFFGISNSSEDDSSGGGFSALRSFRLFRLFKLAK